MRARRINKRAAFWVVVVVAVLALVFVFAALPNVAGIAEEGITTSMLRHGAQRTLLERVFRATHADWHVGEAWQVGESFTSPPLSWCAINCDDEIQVSYMRGVGMCVVWGDRISILFDKSGRVEKWYVEHAVDGC